MEELSPQEDELFDKLVAENIVDDEPVVEEVPEPAAEEPPVNQDAEKALRGGWKPKDEFVAAGGDPDDWVSARRFNIDGKKMAKIRELEGLVHSSDQRTKEVIEHVRATERKKAEDAIQAASDDKWKAIEEGDIEAARKAEAREEALRKPKEPEPQPVDTALWEKVEEVHEDARQIAGSPAFQQWLPQQSAAIQWAYFNSPDPRDGIEIFNRFKGGNKPAQRQPPPVSQPQRVATPIKEAGYSGLSREAKSTFLEFVRLEMVTDTKEAREEYAKECFQRGEA